MKKTVTYKIFGAIFLFLTLFSIIILWSKNIDLIGLSNNPTLKDLNKATFKIFDIFSYILPIYLLILASSFFTYNKNNLFIITSSLSIMPIITFSMFKQILLGGANQSLSNIENYKIYSAMILILGVVQIVSISGLTLFNKKTKKSNKEEDFETYQPPSLFKDETTNETKESKLSFSPDTSERPNFDETQTEEEITNDENSVIEISLKNDNIDENIKNSKNEPNINISQDEEFQNLYSDDEEFSNEFINEQISENRLNEDIYRENFLPEETSYTDNDIDNINNNDTDNIEIINDIENPDKIENTDIDSIEDINEEIEIEENYTPEDNYEEEFLQNNYDEDIYQKENFYEEEFEENFIEDELENYEDNPQYLDDDTEENIQENLDLDIEEKTEEKLDLNTEENIETNIEELEELTEETSTEEENQVETRDHSNEINPELSKMVNIDSLDFQKKKLLNNSEQKREIKKRYSKPGIELLNKHQINEYWEIDEETKEEAEILTNTLKEFKINAEVTGIKKGPVITMFEVLPEPGVKLSKILGLSDNIALRLAAKRVRIVAPIPGKHAVGIEIPNKERALVTFKEMIDDNKFKSKKYNIPIILGKDISGETQIMELTKTPHLLIAGATGSGKSVCVNTLITSILYKQSPKDVKLIMIDPKIVELKLYNDIPHLLTPVITDPKRAMMAIQYAISEMERRYNLFDKIGSRNLQSYNEKVKNKNIFGFQKLPYIVIIIDEFADLMATSKKDLDIMISRLAAKARAVGIHLVLATQRPSTDIITGTIKANFPSRIAFMTASQIDSRTIIDSGGAEKLLGQGDMLYISSENPYPTRIQGAFLSEEEVESVTNYCKQFGEPDYLDEEIFEEETESYDETAGDDDPLFDRAVEIVVYENKASASFLQRKLSIGYNRAARIVEFMEQRGIVGPVNGSKPRDVLITPDQLNK